MFVQPVDGDTRRLGYARFCNTDDKYYGTKLGDTFRKPSRGARISNCTNAGIVMPRPGIDWSAKESTSHFGLPGYFHFADDRVGELRWRQWHKPRRRDRRGWRSNWRGWELRNACRDLYRDWSEH